MDFIFDCFFENTFAKINRDGLHFRHSRRDVLDHLNAVIGGCSDGQNVRPEEAARLAVLSSVKYHRENKTSNNGVCLMGKYHNVLYISLRTCWEWGVRDSEVVINLLGEIYSCEKTFERLFLGAIFGPNAPHFIAGWRSDFYDQDENIKAMVYYLEHATNLAFSLPVHIERCSEERQLKFIDIPIDSCGKSSPLRVALQASTPEILMILLRYGAEPEPPDGGSSLIIALLDKLLEQEGRYSFQLISCLNILLMNIPVIPLPFMPYTFETRKSMFLKKYGTLIIDNIVKVEHIFGVSSLKHLCRCQIRDLLRTNNQLPIGIDTLKLPRKLQRYVDLTED